MQSEPSAESSTPLNPELEKKDAPVKVTDLRGTDKKLDRFPHCELCGEGHEEDIPSLVVLDPKELGWLSHDEKNISHETLSDGTEIVNIESGFGHMSAIIENEDGTHTVRCVNSVEEREASHPVAVAQE